MTFRIGVVGLGYRIGYLMQVIGQTQQDVEFVGYVDPKPAGLGLVNGEGVPGISVDPEALKRFDPGRQFASLEELIEKGNLDLLMVGSPNHLHLEHLRIAIKSGIKTFAEKPVVTTEAQTFELLGLLAEAKDVDQVMIGLVLRYAPLYRDLIAARDDGKLGNIASIEASEHIAPYHGAFFMRDWRRNSRYSGGFMLEKCCHDLDLYQGLVGSRPKRVASFGGRRSFVPENKHQNCPMSINTNQAVGMAVIKSLIVTVTSSTIKQRSLSIRAVKTFAFTPI